MTSALGLERVRLDGGTQPRAASDPATIAEYAEHMRAGDTFPPVVVFHDGTDHWLADGFHRVAACRAAGLASVAADVRQGTRRDAVLYSAGANATHGLRRSNADKRRAVLTLLGDPEWSQWSDREIARRCAVSNRFVGVVRAELAVNGSQSPTARRYTRGGAEAVMQTAGIGRRAADPGGELEAALAELQRKVSEPEPSDPGEAFAHWAAIRADAAALIGRAYELRARAERDAGLLLRDATDPQRAVLEALLAAAGEERAALMAEIDAAAERRIAELQTDAGELAALLARLPYPLHPAAEVFPLMSSADFDTFCASVKGHGLLIPITLYQGAILDGKLRALACMRTGVPMRFEEYTGADPFAFVWSKNGARASYDEGQRACAAVKVAELRQAGADDTAGQQP